MSISHMAIFVYMATQHHECPGYVTKQSDGEVPVMLELWTMQSIPSLPSLLGPLWHGVVALDRVIFMDQIELHTYAKTELFELELFE